MTAAVDDIQKTAASRSQPDRCLSLRFVPACS